MPTLSTQKVETPTELSKTSEGESLEFEDELGSIEYSDLIRQVMNQSSEQSADIMVHESSSMEESVQSSIHKEQAEQISDTDEADFSSLPRREPTLKTEISKSSKSSRPS